MKKDEVIRMAREAGLFEVPYPNPGNMKEVERFASFVAAAEREACLQIADYCADANMPASMAANAIRARGIE